MRPTRTGARAARRPAGAYAAVVAALMLAAFALLVHHGSVPRQALQTPPTAPAAAAAAGEAAAEAPHAHPGIADIDRPGDGTAADGRSEGPSGGVPAAAADHAAPDPGATGDRAPAHPEAAVPPGHDHGGQDDCGPASGTCQSAKVTVDVALPPRARLILPGPAPRPLPLPHAARAAVPTPPELAELSILRI
ncbi:hypothetical protein O4J56_22505 [Nocardiopsis sp. RSe5-2]|uniref:Uncharacterized protein n=1 Tax=Nocardiopsis endophytica TaxID=3018445 RepID=A0ABT4U909_9ACTN|nr:hypothetical protein [Nocardiopsis endophytica]MDA2813435.1 hypothetical protein [Nocardiopsis endophytica]